MAFNVNQWIQNPWTQMGAAILAGTDPQRTMMGGLGQGILHTGRRLREDERYQAEQERNRQMADLQTRLLTARLGETERKIQRGRDVAAIVGSPEYAAASSEERMSMLAPHMGEEIGAAQIQQQFAKPSDFMSKLAMVGGDLDRYKSIFGSAPTINLLPSPPTGHRYTQNEAGEVTGVEKIAGFTSKEDQKILDTYESAVRAIDRVETHLGAYGTEPLPMGGKGKMSASVKALMLTVKELANLGVLSGSDEAIVIDLIGDPTEITAGVKGERFYRGKLEEAREYIKSKVPSRLLKVKPKGRTEVTPSGIEYTVEE